MRGKPAGNYVTRGGRKLSRFLNRRGVGISEFAKRAGVSRVTVHNVMTGIRWRHITVDFALAVVEACDGVLEFADFASITATAKDASDSDEDASRRANGTYG